MAADLLVPLLRIFAIAKSKNPPRHLTRVAILLLDAIVFSYDIHAFSALSEMIASTSEMTYLMYFTLTAEIACSASLYTLGVIY